MKQNETELKQLARNFVKEYLRENLILDEEALVQFATEATKELEAENAELKKQSPVWHKIFTNNNPSPCEYWELPQENLPKNENFYFVKLKNGYIKICKLKYDSWSRKKYFYDLHGGTQSDVAEWLEYPKGIKE